MTGEGAAGHSLRSPNTGLSDLALLRGREAHLAVTSSPCGAPGGGAWAQHRSLPPVCGHAFAYTHTGTTVQVGAHPLGPTSPAWTGRHTLAQAHINNVPWALWASRLRPPSALWVPKKGLRMER